MRPWVRTLHRIWVFTGAVATVLFIAYNLLASRATGAAERALRSDSAVEVARGETRLTFTPSGSRKGVALAFFGGALVDPVAYAPLMRGVAENGHLAVLLALPAKSAPTAEHEREAIRRALAVVGGSPDLQWVVGGHSKGGAVASLLARDHPRSIAGLLLVGTSHPREFTLATLGVPVVKVYGTLDGLASEAEVRQFARNLPEETRFVAITGGNHSQFGYYGPQLGDRAATVSREDQQAQLLEATLEMLAGVEAAAHGEAIAARRP